MIKILEIRSGSRKAMQSSNQKLIIVHTPILARHLAQV